MTAFEEYKNPFWVAYFNLDGDPVIRQVSSLDGGLAEQTVLRRAGNKIVRVLQAKDLAQIVEGYPEYAKSNSCTQLA